MLHPRVAAVSLALAITVAACGSEESSAPQSSAPPSAPPTDAPTAATTDAAPATTAAGGTAGTVAGGSLNDADVEFAQGMIAHHEQALAMAEIALDPNIGASPEVVDLATRIQATQEPEIQVMTAWLTAANEPTTMDMSGGHDMSSMDGMMSAEEMDALAAATGPEFDQMWLEMMIAHHEGAIDQAETVKANGANAEVLALADEIISTQEGEITEMQALLEA